MRLLTFCWAIVIASVLTACGGGGGSAGISTGPAAPTPAALFTTAPPTVTLANGASVKYVISGGVAPYLATTDVISRVTATIDGTALTITANEGGSVSVFVTDSKGARLIIPVSVGLPDALFTTAPSSMTIVNGTTNTFTIGGGSPPYLVNSSNVTVAIASVKGSVLSIAGLSSGSASLVVSDAKRSTVTIAVAVPGPTQFFSTAPSNVNIPIGSIGTYSLSGGLAPYTATASDPTVASAFVNGGTLSISAIAGGSTFVKVIDTSGALLTIAVSVGSSTALFVNSPGAVTLGAGTTPSYQITGGTAPYTVNSTDSRVVTASINGGTLNVFPLKSGAASLSVIDAAGKIVAISVTVDGTTGPSAAAVIDLFSSASFLSSAQGSLVTISVNVKDGLNKAIPGQAVSFSATNGGTLFGANPTPVTDASGTINTITLSPGSDASNRSITVTASVGSVAKSIVIPVVGSSLSISGAGSTLVGTRALSYTVKAIDSGGKAVVGTTLSVSSSLGNSVSPQSVVTDVSGSAVVSFSPTVPGIDTLTVSGLGTSAKTTVSVSNEDLSFLVPLPAASLIVNTNYPVTVRYKVGGVGIAGQTVVFSSTRGSVASTNVTTNANGDATTTVSSSTAGPVTISAQLAAPSTARTSVTAAFVAILPATIVLQANPGAVFPNTNGSTNNQSTLTATVRDATGNPVANKVVNFTAIQDLSNGSISPGSSTTDSNGIAVAQFIPGALTTSSNGVQLRASVQENPSINATAILTVSGNALFISIAISSKVTEFDTTTIDAPFSVYVVDVNGAPAANRTVTLSIFPPVYGKGLLVVVPTKGWQFSPSSPLLCVNEDRNRNGILDTGEDVNGDGKLYPGLPAIITPSLLVTDAKGYATFSLRYGKNYALWVSFDITARALVGGTESSAIVPFVLPMISSEQADEKNTPANYVSPFGTSTSSCTNPN